MLPVTVKENRASLLLTVLCFSSIILPPDLFHWHLCTPCNFRKAGSEMARVREDSLVPCPENYGGCCGNFRGLPSSETKLGAERSRSGRKQDLAAVSPLSAAGEARWEGGRVLEAEPGSESLERV